MSIKVTGLDEFERQLRDLSDRVEALGATQSVPLSELFTPDFLATCSTLGH